MTAMAVPGGQIKETEPTTQATTTQATKARPQASNTKKSSDIDDQAIVLQQFAIEKDGQKGLMNKLPKTLAHQTLFWNHAGNTMLFPRAGMGPTSSQFIEIIVVRIIAVLARQLTPSIGYSKSIINAMEKGYRACSSDSDLIKGIT